MRKYLEVSRSISCLNKALPREPVFVLLGRDPAAPAAIAAWKAERIRLGIDDPTAMKLQGADRAIAIMNAERPKHFLATQNRMAEARAIMWGELSDVEAESLEREQLLLSDTDRTFMELCREVVREMPGSESARQASALLTTLMPPKALGGFTPRERVSEVCPAMFSEPADFPGPRLDLDDIGTPPDLR